MSRFVRPHAKYRHLFVVVRVDTYQSPGDDFSLVSAWWTETEADEDCARLNEISSEGSYYDVTVTRLKSAD